LVASEPDAGGRRTEAGRGAVDWRPYRATLAVLALAIALNLATGNALWLGYSLFGLAVFALVAGLVRAGRMRPDPLAAWLVGLSLSLHYAGGSLSGLHQVGGPNGLYYAFPWWDNLAHALGLAGVGVAACAVLLRVLPGRLLLCAFLGLCVAAFVGTLVELYEFAQYLAFGTVDQGFYTNTMVDLYSDLVGGALGSSLYALAWRRKALAPGAAPRPAAGPGP
jgi:hypothetical protein